MPILAHMMRDGVTASRFKELQEPECIIVAPTRELIDPLSMRKFRAKAKIILTLLAGPTGGTETIFVRHAPGKDGGKGLRTGICYGRRRPAGTLHT